jgi:hypothetical protein
VIVKSFVFWDITPSVQSQPTFWENMSPSSSGSKNKPTKKACYMLHAGFLLGLFFDLEDRGDMFLRNVGCLSGLHGVISQDSELFESLPYRIKKVSNISGSDTWS